MHTEPNINLMTTFLLLGGFNGIFLGWLLLYLRRKNLYANRFLAFILVSRGLTLIHQFLDETHLLYQVPALSGYILLTEVMLPPALYLYVRNMTQPFNSQYSTWFHFVPSLLVMAAIMPFFMLDFQSKMSVVNSSFIDWPSGILQTSIPIAIVIWATQLIFYLTLSFKLLFIHTQSIRHFFSYSDKISLHWLRNFLLLNIVTGIFLAYFFVSFAQSEKNIKPVMDLFLYFSVLLIFYLGLKGLKQRRIYSVNPHSINTSHDLVENKPQRDNEVLQTSTVKKYKNSALTPDMSEKILTRLNAVMINNKPHLNNDLTLRDLAKLVAVSPNYLSQVINESLQMNFFDYVNSYRIEVAKALITESLMSQLTIHDIAMEAAFNSKSAFYSAFKKQVGITPAAYKRNQLSTQP